MADIDDDAFAQAFEQIAKEDARGVKAPKAASISSADNPPPVQENQPQQQVQEGVEGGEETNFEVPSKTPNELIAEAEAAIAAAKSPEEKTAAETLKAEAETAKAEAEAAKAQADADAAAQAAAQAETQSQQEWVRNFMKTMGQQQPPQDQQPQQPQPQQPQNPFTQEEIEILQKYEQDFPDVARAEFIRRKAEYNQMMGYIFSEMAAQLQPMIGALRSISQRVHLGDLQNQVQDYNTIRDQVVEWVGKQPAYIKSAYERVVQEGTAEEVADLVNRWRAETGQVAAQPQKGSDGNGSKKPARAPTEAAKAAAAALAPVAGKRTIIPQAQPTTFDDAFAQFAQEG